VPASGLGFNGCGSLPSMTATTSHTSTDGACPYPHGDHARPRPPLVKSTPFMGALPRVLGNMHQFMTETRAQYGDAFRLKVVGHELTCLCGDDAIALLNPGTCLSTGESMKILDQEMQSVLPSTFEGPQHKMFRRTHIDFLTANLENRRHAEIQARLKHHTDTWRTGQRINVLQAAQAQTVDVLSILLNGEPFPFSHRDLVLTVRTMIGATYANLPSWVLKNPFYVKVKDRIRQHMLEFIGKMRVDPDLIESTLAGRYLSLDPPLGKSRWENEDLAAVPYGAYLAGFDTVASASSILVYRLLTHPEHLRRVREEYADLAAEHDGVVAPVRQKYMRAAFWETCRINPPGTIVMRLAERDFTFGNYTIRKGDELLVMIASGHLDADNFEQPHRWDPTRFVGEGASAMKRKVRPFGAGAHRCTGAVLGELIAVEMASYWVNHFDLEVAPRGYALKVASLPFTQPVGLKVKVHGRRSP